MKKLIAAVFAGLFATVSISAAFLPMDAQAQEKKDEKKDGKKKDEKK